MKKLSLLIMLSSSAAWTHGSDTDAPRSRESAPYPGLASLLFQPEG